MKEEIKGEISISSFQLEERRDAVLFTEMHKEEGKCRLGRKFRSAVWLL